MTIVFSSKDPLLAKYYEFQFRDMFAREAQIWAIATDPGAPSTWADLYGMWRRRMLLEAEMQEHYDYTVDERGRRTPIRDEFGNPVLLIPEVTVYDQGCADEFR